MKKIFSYFIFLSLFFIISALGVNAKEIPAPTILKIGEKIVNESEGKYFVKGLTEEGTDILIYVNGTFVDNAKVDTEETGTDSFYFEGVLNSDKFEVMAIARDRKTYILSPPSSQKHIIAELPAPTLIFPEDNIFVTDSRIEILGLSKTNSVVEIYIDSKLVHETKYLTHESGTANFAYFTNILTQGSHSIFLKAKDRLGRYSDVSEIVYFEIEHPMSAPTLFDPVVNNNTTMDKPFVVGVAKNDSAIKVYIDDEYDGEFLVENHESGTANFAYITKKELSRGEHVFSTTATDKKGKESKKSNKSKFTVRQPSIAIAVQEVNDSIVEEAVVNEVVISEEEPIVLSENNIDSALVSENIDEKDDSILDNDFEGEVSQEDAMSGGALNENSEKQSKINIDLLIFIAFLLGIIVWIIWVNKELVKEKKSTKSVEGENESKK